MENIMVSNSLRKFTEKNSLDYLFRPCENGENKMKYIQSVVDYGMSLRHSNVNEELLKIVLKLQFLGFSFMNGSAPDFRDVRSCNQRGMAIHYISNFLKQEGCTVTPDWLVVIDVIRNFGVPEKSTFSYGHAEEYMQLAYAADKAKFTKNVNTGAHKESFIRVANA